MSDHRHDAEFVPDEGFWNERYHSSPRIWSGNPNPQLVAEIANLEPGRALDLVSAQFMHLPVKPRTRLFTALARSVRAGGTLLVVGHHPSDLATGVPRPSMPELLYSAADVARLLDDSWAVVVNEARPRPATTPDGVEVTVHDAVLRAIRAHSVD